MAVVEQRAFTDRRAGSSREARHQNLPTAARPHAHAVNATTPGRAVLKRTMDITVSVIALLLLTPLLAAVAIAIVAQDGGPVFFRQVRVGRDGEHFVMHKFRSMTVDAEARRAHLLPLSEGNGIQFKMHNDPRVTRLGHLLRRYSLDELPQFWDALRGRMSVVGPRPALPEEVAVYDVDARRRLQVKPGITGAWQVGGRSNLSWEDSLRLDLDYIDSHTLALDAVIVLRTFRAVIRAEGAY